MAHASNINAQLNAALRDDDVPDDLKERIRARDDINADEEDDDEC